MRQYGKHPKVCDYIADLIDWRMEQKRGMGELPITEWMAECLEQELGGEVKDIDGVKLTVIPNSNCLSVELGLKVEEQS